MVMREQRLEKALLALITAIGKSNIGVFAPHCLFLTQHSGSVLETSPKCQEQEINLGSVIMIRAWCCMNDLGTRKCFGIRQREISCLVGK